MDGLDAPPKSYRVPCFRSDSQGADNDDEYVNDEDCECDSLSSADWMELLRML
jgi:hypothetical protein